MKLNLLFLLVNFSLLFLVSCGGAGYDDDEDEYYDDDGPIGFHYQGRDCSSCHSFSGGTVFKRLDAPNDSEADAVPYATVKLVFPDSSVYKAMLGRGTGNFIVPKGILKDWFTAVVVDQNGREVNKSLDFAHSPDRYACNTCHTSQGLEGAPGRIVNYDFYGIIGGGP